MTRGFHCFHSLLFPPPAMATSFLYSQSTAIFFVYNTLSSVLCSLRPAVNHVVQLLVSPFPANLLEYTFSPISGFPGVCWFMPTHTAICLHCSDSGLTSCTRFQEPDVYLPPSLASPSGTTSLPPAVLVIGMSYCN